MKTPLLIVLNYENINETSNDSRQRKKERRRVAHWRETMNYDLPGFIKLGENIVAYQCERAHTHTHSAYLALHNLVLVLETPYLSTRRNLSIFYFSLFFSSIVRYYLSRHFFTPLLLDASSTLNKLNFPVETDSGGGGHNERTRSRKTKRHK